MAEPTLRNHTEVESYGHSGPASDEERFEPFGASVCSEGVRGHSDLRRQILSNGDGT